MPERHGADHERSHARLRWRRTGYLPHDARGAGLRATARKRWIRNHRLSMIYALLSTEGKKTRRDSILTIYIWLPHWRHDLDGGGGVVAGTRKTSAGFAATAVQRFPGRDGESDCSSHHRADGRS